MHYACICDLPNTLFCKVFIAIKELLREGKIKSEMELCEIFYGDIKSFENKYGIKIEEVA